MRLLLVRHATCAPVGRALAGRSAGVRLSEAGRAQAASLARRLAREPIAAVYSSPLERALETAQAIGAAASAPVHVEAGLVELDFGAWTGRAIAALEDDAQWRYFNTYRSGTRAPDGELALEAQARAVAAAQRIASAHPSATVVAVSHADVIKAVLGHALGVPLDLQHRMEIAPASLSVLELHEWGPRVLHVNVETDVE